MNEQFDVLIRTIDDTRFFSDALKDRIESLIGYEQWLWQYRQGKPTITKFADSSEIL